MGIASVSFTVMVASVPKEVQIYGRGSFTLLSAGLRAFCYHTLERSLGEVGDGVVLDAVFFFLFFLFSLFSLFSGVVSSGASWGMLLFLPLLVALTTGICGNDSSDSEGGGSLTVYSAALRALCCCTMERSFGEVRDGAVLDAVFFFSFFLLGVANAVFLVVFVGLITLAFSAT